MKWTRKYRCLAGVWRASRAHRGPSTRNRFSSRPYLFICRLSREPRSYTVTHNFPPNGRANAGGLFLPPPPSPSPPPSPQRATIMYMYYIHHVHAAFHFPSFLPRPSSGIARSFVRSRSIREKFNYASKKHAHTPVEKKVLERTRTDERTDGSRDTLSKRRTPLFYSISPAKLQTGMMHRN